MSTRSRSSVGLELKADASYVLRLGYVSGDSHVNEPRNLWRDNLPASLRTQAMQGIKAGDDGNWDLLFESQGVDQSTQYETDRLRMADPAHRHAVMREEGIVGECVFPTIGLYVWMLTDAIARLAVGLDNRSVASVFRENAARLFHFSDEVLSAPVEVD
jgi:hypothetical protein